MGLIDILAQPWNQYRQGIIFCMQKGDYDAVMLMIKAMSKVLPPDSRPSLPELPKVNSIEDDLQSRRNKWLWCDTGLTSIEDSISRWVHDNFDRVSM
jgi:hypothetical protein|tara:strand:+ start:944 stop:1234 length:291 start_codon:yes stop_codon:yes gene_type:complete